MNPFSRQPQAPAETQPPVTLGQEWSSEMPAQPPMVDGPLELHAAEPLAIVTGEAQPPMQAGDREPPQPTAAEEAAKAQEAQEAEARAEAARQAAKQARKAAKAATKAQRDQEAADKKVAQDAAQAAAQAANPTPADAPKLTKKQQKKAAKAAARKAQADLDELIDTAVSGQYNFTYDEDQFAAIFGADAKPKFVKSGKAVEAVADRPKKIFKFAANGKKESKFKPYQEEAEPVKEKRYRKVAKNAGKSLLRRVFDMPNSDDEAADKTAKKAKASKPKSGKANKGDKSNKDVTKDKDTDKTKNKASKAKKSTSKKSKAKTANPTATTGHWATWEARQVVATPAAPAAAPKVKAPDFWTPGQEPAAPAAPEVQQPIAADAGEHKPLTLEDLGSQAHDRSAPPKPAPGETVRTPDYEPTVATVARPVGKTALRPSKPAVDSDEDRNAGYL